MNAINFIQLHGVEKAREELTKLPNSNVTHMTSDARMFIDENNPLLDEFQRGQIKDLICIEELKRLIDSVDYLNEWYEGKIDDAYDHVERMHGMLMLRPQFPNLHSRIQLVEGHLSNWEQIFGGEHV